MRPGGSVGARALGVLLVVATGLLNFHLPHFLLESSTPLDAATRLLELVFLSNLLGAIAAAVGIARGARWGWSLGIVVAIASFLLYVAQETVGLPGLPQSWSEPSRILAVVIEAAFAVTARRHLIRRG
jgi:hypothetical protein